MSAISTKTTARQACLLDSGEKNTLAHYQFANTSILQSFRLLIWIPLCTYRARSALYVNSFDARGKGKRSKNSTALQKLKPNAQIRQGCVLIALR